MFARKSSCPSLERVNTVQNLSVRGVGLRVLTGQGAQIDTTTAAGRLVFGIFAALAEFERELIQESGVHVRHERGDRAFYNMQTDTVIGEVHHQVKLTESAAPDWRMIPARGHDAGVAMFEAVGSGKTAACMPPFAPHRRRTPLSGFTLPGGNHCP